MVPVKGESQAVQEATTGKRKRGMPDQVPGRRVNRDRIYSEWPLVWGDAGRLVPGSAVVEGESWEACQTSYPGVGSTGI